MAVVVVIADGHTQTVATLLQESLQAGCRRDILESPVTPVAKEPVASCRQPGPAIFGRG